jgi:adenosyl cobinamide kinase/adenosyl cobinamide phosphate guanylyltransferase
MTVLEFMAEPLNHKCHQPANFNIFLLSSVTILVTNLLMRSELHALSTEEVPLVLTEQIANLLTEATEKTGRSIEELILVCLEHGLEMILKNSAT